MSQWLINLYFPQAQTNQPKKILPADGQVSYHRAGTFEIDPEKQARDRVQKVNRKHRGAGSLYHHEMINSFLCIILLSPVYFYFIHPFFFIQNGLLLFSFLAKI